MPVSNLNVLTKDLHRLGRDLSKTIIVDNSIYAFAYNLPNGIPIPSYYGQRNDRELISLVSLIYLDCWKNGANSLCINRLLAVLDGYIERHNQPRS